MSPERQRIVIAELCGIDLTCYRFSYTGHDHRPATRNRIRSRETAEKENEHHAMWPGTTDVEPYIEMSYCPDYLNDLNAMHEAEKVLTDEQYRKYTDTYLVDCICGNAPRHLVGDIYMPTGMIRWYSATAAQRSEAFLRTIGKWEESQ